MDGAPHPGLYILIEGEDQRLLARKVVEQSAVGHPGRLGDSSGGSPLQAIFGAEGEGGIQDLAALVGHGLWLRDSLVHGHLHQRRKKAIISFWIQLW